MQIRLLGQRKAQFYIISALIIIAIIAALSVKANAAFSAPSPVKFYDLSDNFEQEGYKIIDTYIFQGSKQQIADQIENFTKNFLEYAREKDPNVGLVYIYGNETDVFVSNHALTTITQNTSSGEGRIIESPDITSLSNITISVPGNNITRDVSQKASVFNVLGTAFTKKTQTKWVVLNIAGVLYPFNTAGDNKDFYVVVVTNSSTEGEKIFTGTPNNPMTCTSPYATYDINNVNLRCAASNSNPAATACCKSVINCITNLAERSNPLTCANGPNGMAVCATKGQEGCCNGLSCTQCYCSTKEICNDGFDNNGNNKKELEDGC